MRPPLRGFAVVAPGVTAGVVSAGLEVVAGVGAFAAEFAGAGWEAAAAMVRVFPPSENVACNGTVPTRSRMADPFVSLRLEEAKGGSL